MVVANVPTPDSIIIKEVPRPALADKQVRVHGKVTNSKTGEMIGANVFFDAPENDQTAGATISEGYSVIIPSTNNYVVKIEAIGYVSTMEKLDINTYEMNDLEMNFKLQP